MNMSMGVRKALSVVVVGFAGIIVLLVILQVFGHVPKKESSGSIAVNPINPIEEFFREKHPETPVGDISRNMIVSDYQEVIISDDRDEYLIMAGGKLTYLSDMAETVSVVFSPDPSNVSVFNESCNPIDPANTMLYGNYGEYRLSFDVPSMPGAYDVAINRSDNDRNGSPRGRREIAITVVDDIETGEEAFSVAENHVQTTISKEANAKEFRLKKKSIIENKDGWQIDIELDYKSCGIDWYENACSQETVSKRVFVNRQGMVKDAI